VNQVNVNAREQIVDTILSFLKIRSTWILMDLLSSENRKMIDSNARSNHASRVFYLEPIPRSGGD